MRLLFFTFVAMIFSHAAPGGEKPDYVTDKPELPKDEDAKYGWDGMLKGSGSFAFTHSDSMVGIRDGMNINLGIAMNGGLDFLSEKGHMWQSKLDWQLSYIYTDTLDSFTKGLDSLVIDSAYLYQIPKAKYLGPFASLTLKATLFPGYDMSTSDTVVRYLDADGNEEKTELVEAKDKIDLTPGFAPATLRESVGFFFDAMKIKPINIQFRLGVGAWETFVSDGYCLADDGSTPELEIKAMQDSVQFGAELKAMLSGVLYKDIINYDFKLGLMYPFVHNVDTDMSGMDLFNIEIEAKVGFRIAKWLAIDYVLKAYHVPFIYDGWQVQNGIFLVVTVGILGKKG
ncbi:MAG: hypothetical protein ABIJ56_04360 [Pseudomonadota bacterium]